jgi:hypothetical protein
MRVERAELEAHGKELNAFANELSLAPAWIKPEATETSDCALACAYPVPRGGTRTDTVRI